MSKCWECGKEMGDFTPRCGDCLSALKRNGIIPLAMKLGSMAVKLQRERKRLAHALAHVDNILEAFGHHTVERLKNKPLKKKRGHSAMARKSIWCCEAIMVETEERSSEGCEEIASLTSS